MNKQDFRFSVAMSVYKKDEPRYLDEALRSIVDEQTLRPSEVVIVGDGPLPEAVTTAIGQALPRNDGEELTWHEGVDDDGTRMRVTEYVLRDYPETRVRLLLCERNRGLGWALRTACAHCTCGYIARMDSDDLSLPRRFEQQMQLFRDDPDVGMVGGMITEFVGEPSNIVSRRVLPLDNEGIYRMMRSRCGVNHVTVIMRRSDLMAAGNYSGRFRQEDYYLWARMMKHGVKMRNIPDVVVNVRSGDDQFARRGGLRYFRQHMKVFRYMYHEGLISLPTLLKNYVLRFSQVALPTHLRTWVYHHLLRKS